MLDGHGISKHRVRVCWECWVEALVCEMSNSHFQQKFDNIVREIGNSEASWAMFPTSIVEVAAMSCGCKVVGALHVRPRWSLALKQKLECV